VEHEDQDAFRVGQGPEAVTEFTEARIANILGRSFHFYDTPGDGDPGEVEERRRNKEITTLRAAGYINVVVIVVNWNAPRLDIAKEAMLKKYARMFGRPIWQNLCFVFTGIKPTRRRGLENDQTNWLQEWCDNAIAKMGGDDDRSVSPSKYFVIEPRSSGSDRASADERLQLLQWATTLPPLLMDQLRCPDPFYRSVVTVEEEEVDSARESCWNFVKVAGGVAICAGLVVGAVALAPLIAGTAAVGPAAAAGTAAAARGGAAIAILGAAAEVAAAIQPKFRRRFRVTTYTPWHGPVRTERKEIKDDT
jgi:hypothetical protein